MNCLYCGDYGCEECSSFDVESSRMYVDLETQLKASQDECNELKQMQAHLKWKDETKKQLKASQAIIKEAHDKLLNVNAVSWEETAWEVKEILKIKEVKR